MIRTPRLVLRAFVPADEETLLSQWNDPDVRRFLFDDQPVSREAVREQIEASFAGLRPYGDAGTLELLYALVPQSWGRGLATEAARAVLAHGFDTCQLDEIHAGADPPNAASFEVMERLGMSRPADITLNGRPARYYRITRGEFRGKESHR